LQLEKMYQKLNDAETKLVKGKSPANPPDETSQAIITALKRIESLEKQDLTVRISQKGPDEIYAMNETQRQIDSIVDRNKDLLGRLTALEDLTSSMVRNEDEKNSVELKGMMSNLKSKFSFLDANAETGETRSLPTQVAVLEERLQQIGKMVMDTS